MQTVLDFRSFDPRYRLGLIFSIFEGLIQGEAIKIICADDPQILQTQFSEAQVKNIKWKIFQIATDIWEVELAKIKEHQGCCGLCGNS